MRRPPAGKGQGKRGRRGAIARLPHCDAKIRDEPGGDGQEPRQEREGREGQKKKKKQSGLWETHLRFICAAGQAERWQIQNGTSVRETAPFAAGGQTRRGRGAMGAVFGAPLSVM